MNYTTTIEARRFPVSLVDERTGQAVTDFIVLDKRHLQAAELVGQSSKELIYRHYNARGFRVLEVGKPERRTISLDLAQLWALYDRMGVEG